MTRPEAATERVDRVAFPYRMKDLCDRTGLERQAIHFYIQQGLLPEGHKTGRNMAYYGESHLARLKLIRQLQEERFLPLKAIRAVLDETHDGFTAQQRALLLDVKQRLAPVLGARSAGGEVPLVELSEVRLRTGVSKKDVDELVEHGIVSVIRRKGKAWIARDDAWILETWREMEKLGFTRDLGFAPADMLVFIDALNGMFQREASMLKERLAHLPPEQVAPMVERSIPIINQFMARYHDALVRSFFASVQPEAAKEKE